MTCAWKITQYGWTQHTLQIILYICFVSLATVEPPTSMPILVATPGKVISKYQTSSTFEIVDFPSYK